MCADKVGGAVPEWPGAGGWRAIAASVAVLVAGVGLFAWQVYPATRFDLDARSHVGAAFREMRYDLPVLSDRGGEPVIALVPLSGRDAVLLGVEDGSRRICAWAKKRSSDLYFTACYEVVHGWGDHRVRLSSVQRVGLDAVVDRFGGAPETIGKLGLPVVRGTP